MTILISNDDGIDSPALVPLVRAVNRLGEVRVVVPDVERSWIAKAISRFDTLRVWQEERDGVAMHAVSGTPADCVNLGVHALCETRPDIVVSGINLGLNYGLCFLLSSGTVGAALEAWIAGVPAIAFSMALPRDAYGLAGEHRAAALGDLPARAAAVSAEILDVILQHGYPGEIDCISVNMPATVALTTLRVVGPVTRTRYAGLFAPTADGGYRHQFTGLTALDEPPTGDMQVVQRGEVSITPLRLDLSAALPDELRRALERRP